MVSRELKQLMIIIVTVFLCACSSKEPEVNKAQESHELTSSPSYNNPSVNSHNLENNSSSAPSTSSTSSTPSKQMESSTIDRYEEGLLDGEAASEEDKLAGRPGMQVGDDEEEFDEDDYDDGYDDSYEE